MTGNLCQQNRTEIHSESTNLQHAENLDAEFIVEVGIFGASHVIDEHQAITLGILAEVGRNMNNPA